MRRGPYKMYLDPNSSKKMPRTTSYRRRKIHQLKMNYTRMDQSTYLCRNVQTNNFTSRNITDNTGMPSDPDPNSDMELNIEPQSCKKCNNNLLVENEFADLKMPDLNHLQKTCRSSLQINYDVDNELQAFYSTNNENMQDYLITENDIEKEKRLVYLNEYLHIKHQITRGDAILMILTLALRHNLSWVAIEDNFKTINAVLGYEAFPATKYKIQKIFPVENEMITYHIYCSYCKRYIKKQNEKKIKTTCQCGNDISEENQKFFLSLNFESQLKRLFENEDIKKQLLYRFERRKKCEENIEDIYDGKLYVELSATDKPLSEKFNFSFSFNTDGCQSADSSNIKVWPIYATLNELPKNARESNVLLIGLWVDNEEPDMNIFLQPFVDEANFLSEYGVQWNINKNQSITSKILPLNCSVDSVARPKLLNLKKYNGYFGCTFCKHPTESVNGYRKFTVSKNVPPLRTDEETKRQMILAVNSNININDLDGVKGPSALMNLNYFNLIKGMIPDSMHSIFLGVVHQYMQILLKSVGKEYYIGSPAQISIINRRLLNIQTPKCITRTPRGLDQINLWKASEWRSWLIWYALPCLKDLIPTKYLSHFALLSSAVNILLQESISQSLLDKAEILLINFVVYMQEYYGKHNMTYNVHLLLHLVESVYNWGPLWMNNCFSYENENRFILQLKKSPKEIALQITKKYLLKRSLQSFSQTFEVSWNTLNFCESLYDRKVKFYRKINDCVLIGSGRPYQLNQEELQCLDLYNGLPIRTVYEKIIVKGIRYTSIDYQRCTKTKDYFFENNSGSVGMIEKILVITENGQDQIVMLYNKISFYANYLENATVSVDHILKCNNPYVNPKNLDYCFPSNIKRPCIFMTIENINYITYIPRGCLGD